MKIYEYVSCFPEMVQFFELRFLICLIWQVVRYQSHYLHHHGCLGRLSARSGRRFDTMMELQGIRKCRKKKLGIRTEMSGISSSDLSLLIGKMRKG